MNNVKKIIEYGLYLLVFLLPLQTRWIIKAGELNGGYWEYGTISLYATDIVLVALILLFAISLFLKSRITNYELRITNYWWVIAWIELFVFISIFFAPSKLLAVFSYIRFLLGVGLFWLIISAEYKKIKLLWSLVAGATIQAILGVWQFINQSIFSSKWLGIAVHNSSELGTSVVETMGFDGIAERWLRAYGGLDHPNILGGFLSIATLLLIIVYINKIPKKCENHNKIFNFQFSIFKQFSIFNFQTVFLFSCFLALLSALFFTFSRGAWAGFLAGLITMLIILFRRKNKQAMKKALEFVFIGAAIILLLFNLYSNLVLTRLSEDTRLEIKSNTERVESYKTAKEIIKKHWLFGVGIGNYTLALRNEIKSPNPLYQGGDQPSWYYQPVHNTFLLIWAETGVLGLAGFLGFLLCVMRYLPAGQAGVLCEKKNSEKALNVALGFSIILALTAMMLVDHWYWSLHFGILFLWVIFGIILKEDNPNKYYGN